MGNIHATTPSPAAEKLRAWLCALREKTGMTQKQFAQAYYQGNQSDQARYEKGSMLPNRERASQLMGMVSGEEAAVLEDLLICARLERAALMQRRGNKLAAAMERAELPVAFYEETLRRTNAHGVETPLLRHWQHCVQPARHRGEYLQAARHVLGMSGDAVGHEERGHFASVLRAEREHYGQLEPELAGFYAHKLATLGKGELFDPRVFEGLPAAITRAGRC